MQSPPQGVEIAQPRLRAWNSHILCRILEILKNEQISACPPLAVSKIKEFVGIPLDSLVFTRLLHINEIVGIPLDSLVFTRLLNSTAPGGSPTVPIRIITLASLLRLARGLVVWVGGT